MNLHTTKTVARKVAHQLQQNKGGIVLLFGPMGAGKTTLVGEIVRILCPTANPCSPTYTVVNQYADNIFHADLYRLWESDGDAAVPNQTKMNQILESIGLMDLCVAGNYVFIEWPNDIDFPNAMRITIKIKEDGDREFIID